MEHRDRRRQVYAKLFSACSALDAGLTLSSTGPKDAAVIPQALRNELSVMADDFRRILRALAETP